MDPETRQRIAIDVICNWSYEQNSLYGSRFCLFNADLYVPLFPDLIPLKTDISAVYNLQLGLFADMAAAQQDPSGYENAIVCLRLQCEDPTGRLSATF
ncbi:hypothetical protein [Taibaiella koreensis]|uniref:hypothetical protein n=1 Tax=Taibaiella koreensis TaxID=1268548 RepID=UPI000E59AAE6|nr:hypothetical protein [Taibaiella koreensis]